MPTGIWVFREPKLANVYLWVKTHLTLNQHLPSTHVPVSELGYFIYIVLFNPHNDSLCRECIRDGIE